MTNANPNEKPLTAAEKLIKCLMVAVKGMGIPATEAAVLQAVDLMEKEASVKQMIRVARGLGVTIKSKRPTPVEMPHLPMPAVAIMRDGNLLYISRYAEDNINLFDPVTETTGIVPAAQFAGLWSGELLLFRRRLTWREISRRYSLQWFTGVILHYKKFLGEVVVASFFLQILGLGMPLFTQVLVDKVIANQGLSTLTVLGFAMVILCVFQSGMNILQTYLLTHTTNKLDTILGTRLFRHLSSLPLPYFERSQVGNIMLIVSGLSTVRTFLTGSFITVLLNAFFSVVFLAIMLSYSVPLTLISMMSIPIYLIQNIMATPIYQQRLKKNFAIQSESNSFLVEAITGMHTVKSLAIEPQFAHRWEQLLARTVKTTFDTAVFSMTINNAAEVIQRLAGFAVLWVGGRMVMDGQMTLGQLIAFQMLANQANGPIMSLVTMWQTAQQSGIAMEALGTMLHNRTEPVLQPPRSGAVPLKGEIVLEKITFRYSSDTEPVLKDVSLNIAAGMRVGIVGRSGSGKSTLTKLIQRLYDPEQGQVLLDGQNVAEVEPQWFRRQTGVVMQENYLFNGSVRENIALARPSATMEEVIRAAETAGAHGFILELPEGYDTKVGERGASLSGGQRQRVAIARALLTDPRVLIFDEATSALDYESERIIMDNLDKICFGRTMVMIAHRLSTVRKCDLIVVIDHGRVLEQGTHEELIAADGLYNNLYMQQEGLI
ncbi:MAG TPA: type I secretion system permease/ATPase [Patescibacteria group bacterium]|nr:type I secretion system permease/ATPase [Patescibacteria group bacterium]